MTPETNRSETDLAIARQQRIVMVEGIEVMLKLNEEKAIKEREKPSPLSMFAGLVEAQFEKGGEVLDIDDDSIPVVREAVRAYAEDRLALKLIGELKGKLIQDSNTIEEVQVTNGMSQAVIWGRVKKLFGENAYPLYGDAFELGSTNGQVALLSRLTPKDGLLLPFTRNIFMKVSGVSDNPEGIAGVLDTKIEGVGVQYEYPRTSRYPLIDLIVQPLNSLSI